MKPGMIVAVSLLRSVAKDRISLGWAVAFPLALMAGLSLAIKDPSHRESLLTGCTAMGALFFALFGVAFEVLQQRNRGVYKLLSTTPYPTGKFVAALILARVTVCTVSAIVVMALGSLVLGVDTDWIGVVPSIGVISLGAMCFAALGFIIANHSGHEAQVSMVTNVAGLPMIFGSNAFYSLDGAPEWVRAICNALPFQHFVDALTGLQTGNGAGVLSECGVVSAFTVFFIALAIKGFNREPSM